MTVLNVDGAMVIFEGVHRLQWVYQDWLSQRQADGGSSVSERILSQVWPDKDTGARIRRRIDQHQRVVIVLEDKVPVIALARHRVPRIPDGAVEIDQSDSTTCLLTIPPFTWLSEKHRQRGEEFARTSTQLAARSPGGALAGPLIEDSLVGTHEPVRFIYGTTPLTFGVLRTAIDRLYRIRMVATRDVTDLGVVHSDSAKAPAERRKAA